MVRWRAVLIVLHFCSCDYRCGENTGCRVDSSHRKQWPLNPCCPNAIHHFYTVSKPKLLFCWIEKVGCTNFKQLLAFPGIRDRAPPKPWKDIIFDASWEKVAFYREPLSRFLSGYLEKCRSKVRVYCELVFGSNTTTFDEAVMSLVGRNKNTLDGHFRQQSDHCGGLGHGLAPFFKLELLEPATSRAKVGAMLRRANLTAPQFDRLFPRNPEARSSKNHHTGAHGKTAAAYADPKHVGVVVNFFYDDYITFQLALPEYARRALLHLQRTVSPHALEEGRLARLLAIGDGPAGGVA